VRSVAFRLRLDEWEDSQLSQVLKTVDQARNEVIAELEERLAMQPRRYWTEGRLRALVDELTDMTVGIKEQLGQDLDDIATTAATQTVAEYNDIFSVDQTLPAFNNVELSPEQLRAMVSTPLGGLQAAEVVANAFDHNLVDRVKQDIDAGLLRGESYRKLVDRVQDNWGGVRNDVVSIVRTQVQEMNVNASWAVADKNRDILQREWEWNAILDTRCCIRCAYLDGQLFDMDDAIPMPRHVRCRCLKRYRTKSWSEITGGQVDMPEIDRAMRPYVLRNGAVNTGGATAEVIGKYRGSYREFFDELPYKRQVEIVGPTRAKLLREGKIKFEDLADSRGRVYALNKSRTGLADEKWADVDVGSGAVSKRAMQISQDPGLQDDFPLALPPVPERNVPAIFSPVDIPAKPTGITRQIQGETTEDVNLLDFLEDNQGKFAGAEKSIDDIKEARKVGRAGLTKQQKEKWLDDEIRRAKARGLRVRHGEQPKTLKVVNDAIDELEKQGIPYPKDLDIADWESFLERKGNVTELTAGSYDVNTNQIALNPKSMFWENDADAIEDLSDTFHSVTGHYLSPDYRHQLFHEVGHALHFGYDKTKADRWQKYLNVQKVNIKSRMKDYGIKAGEVSLRAEKDAAEFVAEVFAGKVAGIEFSDNVLKLYRELGGYDK
jgi:SPP1 gp7 family putative phage head morphogenesis protein